MAVLRKGQGIKIAPRTLLRTREIEFRCANRLVRNHLFGPDTRPDATIIRFPVERRMASIAASDTDLIS